MHIAATVFAGARAHSLRSLNSQFNISRKWETTVTLRSPLLPNPCLLFFRRLFSPFLPFLSPPSPPPLLSFSLTVREKQTDVPRGPARPSFFSRDSLSMSTMSGEKFSILTNSRVPVWSRSECRWMSTLCVMYMYYGELLCQSCH